MALGQVEAALEQGGASAGLAPPGAGSPSLVVIVDDNMFYRSMRRVIYRMCRQHASAFLLMYLRVSPGIAAERNQARVGPARVPDAAFQRMVAAFQPPASSGCGWERHSLEVDASAPVDPNAVWERVRDYATKHVSVFFGPVPVYRRYGNLDPDPTLTFDHIA